MLAAMRAPAAGLYLIQDVCELEAPADADRLRAAWREVAGRHAALRTRVDTAASGEPRLAVDPDPEYEWREEDWSALGPGQAQDALEDFLRRDRERGFSFTGGIPMRLALLRTAEGKAILVWSAHHVLLDGRSLTQVWREWLAAYDGDAPGAPGESPPQDAATPVEGAERYWRDYLEGMAPPAGAIANRLFPPVPGTAPGQSRERVSLSAEETRTAHEYAARLGVTAHTLVQGAWALLLSRYSGRDDVVFGVTRAGRGPGATAAGMWIRTLPLRVRIAGVTPAADFLRSLRAQWRAQREYEAAPLEQVCRWAGLPAGAAPFDHLLVYDHAAPIDTLRRQDPRWERRSLRRVQRTDSALTVAAYGEPELSVELIYDVQRYRRETIRPLAGHLLELLRSLIARPEAPLAALNMLTAAERRRLDDLNRTAAPLPAELRAQHLFEREAGAAPGRAAVEWGGGRITYSELNRLANRIAWRLIALGAGRDERIGVCLDRSPLAVASMLGIFKAGAAFLALPPDLPDERLGAMLDAARPLLVLAEGARREWFLARGCAVVDAAGEWEQRDDNPAPRAGMDDAAYAIFTSGSTGRPKAALLAHRGLVNYILCAVAKYGITASDRRLQFASMGTDVFIVEVCCCLSAGATLVLYPRDAGRTMGEFLGTLNERRITLASIPSSWASEWAAAIEGGAAIPQSLRAVVVGMERMQPAAFQTWKRLARGRLRWFNAYGPSETSGVATVYEAGASAWEDAGHVPIGTPLNNVRVYLLDANGEPVPDGLTGEIHVGGDAVGRGYLNAPVQDESRFQPDPFAAGGRMYRTGDLAYRLPDGNLVFLGRADRQVKVRGYRIELEEIEAALAAHPGIRHCAVVAAGPEGRRKLAAYVEAAPGQAGGPSAWSAFLSRRLPEHMLPAGFMVLEKMPVTAGGKIDRLALPAFEPAREESAAPREPRTAIERLLVDLWREALDTARVYADDDFFARGGDSLAATRLIVLIEKHLGRELPLAALLRAPTPALLAALLEEEDAPGTGGNPFLDPVEPGVHPPLVCITTTAAGPRCFERLAWRLRAEQRIRLLPLMDPGPGCGRPVERLADLAWDALRRAMPEGPYLLGGYCLGGVVAFTLAQRLCAAGADVRLVVLFDAAAPGYPKVLSGGKGYLRLAGEWLRGRAAFTWRDITRHLGMMLGLARKQVTRRAPGAARFPVVQFIARNEEITTRVWKDPRLGWRDLCPAGVEFHEIGAVHDNLFEGEAVEEVARRLKEALRRAGPDGNPAGSGPAPFAAVTD